MDITLLPHKLALSVGSCICCLIQKHACTDFNFLIFFVISNGVCFSSPFDSYFDSASWCGSGRTSSLIHIQNYK